MSITVEQWKKENPGNDCHDCGAKSGEEHMPGCDMEHCTECGGQTLCCGGCDGKHDPTKAKWIGYSDGTLKAVEKGWFARMLPGMRGWQPCAHDDEGAQPDLNRMGVFRRTGEDRCYDRSR